MFNQSINQTKIHSRNKEIVKYDEERKRSVQLPALVKKINSTVGGEGKKIVLLQVQA
jgi:hypothetical protein